jgi:hypothetical protein
MAALQARLGPDPKRVEGWTTFQHTINGNKIYVRLLFIADGSIRWDYHPGIRNEDGTSEYPDHHWELDDKRIL